MISIAAHGRSLSIPNPLFVFVQPHLRHETDGNAEVMEIGFGKEYVNDQKINRLIIPVCTVSSFGENQSFKASLHYNGPIVAWFNTHCEYDNFLSTPDLHTQNKFQREEVAMSGVYTGMFVNFPEHV